MWVTISLAIVLIVMGSLARKLSRQGAIIRELSRSLKTQKDEYHQLYNVVTVEVEEMHGILNKSVLKKEEFSFSQAIPPAAAAQSLEEIDGILAKLETYIAKAHVREEDDF